MSLLDWEKKGYGLAMGPILQRREAMAFRLRDIAESYSIESRGEPFCGISKETKNELEAAIKQAVTPPFRVVVQGLHASNGLSYFVTLYRTDGERVPTLRRDGRISPINRHDLDEANSEGYAWASFLGVPFTPCEAEVDEATRHTVPEYGTPLAQDTLKLIKEYKDTCVRMALHPGNADDGKLAELQHYMLETLLRRESMEGVSYEEPPK
jgi:hypothetical protein